MPALSDARASVPLLEGLKLLHRGKVRDSYEIDKDRLLIYATDAISIDDVSLNSLIPQKGMAVTAMSHFSFKLLEEKLNMRTHLLSAGAGIDEHLNAYPHLQRNPNLQARSMVVRRLSMIPIEFIARGCITGSAYKYYVQSGIVCGHKLPEDLQDGDKLPEIIATPTTKSREGHDLPLNHKGVQEEYPEETRLLLEIYSFMSQHCSEHSGIVLADMKLEFGRCRNDTVILGDEISPDSCRFWDGPMYAASRWQKKRTAPTPLDKQMVENWGAVQNITPELEIPEKLITETTKLYRNILVMRTKKHLEEYLQKDMGVDVSKLK